MTQSSRVALITGAAGFAGRHLVAELERETTWELVGIGRRSEHLSSRTLVLACDLLDAQLVERTLDRYRPSYVFHLAAQSYVPQATASPAATLVNNVVGQANLLESCRALDLDPTIVVVGSADEYGLVHPQELPITEAQPFRPANAYAVSKIAQDMLAYQYWAAYGLRIVRLRPFNHFGPGQSDRFVVSGFARQVAQAERGMIEPVILVGNLDAERDFLDVSDVVRAYRLAAERGEPGEVYNVASGTSRRVGDMLEWLIAHAGVPVTARQDPARLRPADTPRLVGDATKFHAATGWSPRFTIEQTLADTLAYWREQLAAAGAGG